MDKSRRCFHAGVEIHSGNDRLHSVGKDRRALPPAVVLLTLAETEIVAQMQLQRHTMERLLADELRAEPRHAALRHIGKMPVQEIRDRNAENGITQKLQPFVADDTGSAVLVGIGTVRYRRFEQRPVSERMAKSLFQSGHALIPALRGTRNRQDRRRCGCWSARPPACRAARRSLRAPS